MISSVYRRSGASVLAKFQPRKCASPSSSIMRYKSAPAAPVNNEKSTRLVEAAKDAASSSVPIVPSLLAAVMGIVTVSAAAATVESATAKSVPPYDPNGQRFDQGNLLGRFSRMLLACDPRLLLFTEEQVRHYKFLLDHHEREGGTSFPSSMAKDRMLWEARRITESALHPDTGDWIPRPFRMSGYVPYNGPVCVAMVASQSTLPLLFWSWINQSQNALVNYYNRNASSTMTNETLAKSYAGAVGSALLVAFGLATFIQRRYEPAQAKTLLRWVAFPSGVAASSLNCYIVRSPEMDSGIPLQDKDGNDVLPGTTSKIAAAGGVYSTTASRGLLQVPVFFVPALLLGMSPFRQIVTKNPAMAVPVSTYMVLVSFGVGLPFTTAIFSQIQEIDAKRVEPAYRQLLNPKTNEPYTAFYYNKGL